MRDKFNKTRQLDANLLLEISTLSGYNLKSVLFNVFFCLSAAAARRPFRAVRLLVKSSSSTCAKSPSPPSPPSPACQIGLLCSLSKQLPPEAFPSSSSLLPPATATSFYTSDRLSGLATFSIRPSFDDDSGAGVLLISHDCYTHLSVFFPDIAELSDPSGRTDRRTSQLAFLSIYDPQSS